MTTYSNSNLLVDPAWLKEHRNDPNLRVLDARTNDPRLPFGYRMGHIPDAIQLDLGREFFATLNGKRELAPVEQIARWLATRGIASDSTVVICDEWTGMLATYAYWTLKYVGHRDARILHGGWAAWKNSGGAVTQDAPQFSTRDYQPQLNPAIRATAEWIQQNASHPDLFLLDTRAEGEYASGHIPGARNLSYDFSIDPATQTFRDAATLRARLEALGATPDKEIVTYCTSGASSSHMFTTLQLLGYPRVRNYDGSMMDWAQARGLPVE